MFNENENIENQAPNLFGLKARDSFKTPKNYFSELEDKIMTENTSLNQFKKESSYKVPQGYFEELPVKIEGKLPKKGILIHLFNYKNFAYAASIALVVTLSLFMFNKQEVTEQPVVSNLLADNMVAYEELTVSDYFSEITEMDILTDGIVFEEITLEDNTIDNTTELIEEIELDPTTLIEFDEEFDLFE